MDYHAHGHYDKVKEPPMRITDRAVEEIRPNTKEKKE